MKFDVVSEAGGSGVTYQAIVCWAPSVGTVPQIHTTKETIQANNKAPKRALLFGALVSFVMMVPAERPGC